MRSMLFIPVIPALLLAGCTLTESSLPLQPDSNWQVAILPNGMKYHLYPTDDSQVSLRLVINSGSFKKRRNSKVTRILLNTWRLMAANILRVIK